MRKNIFITAILIILIGVQNANALKKVKPFDGKRQGPIFAACIGPGITTISSENGELSRTVTKGTVAFNYKIGYAPTEQLMLYMNYNASVYANKLWQHWDDWASEVKKSKTIGYLLVFPFLPVIAMFTDQHLLMGVGADYYLEPYTPCWFFSISAGPSFVSDPYEYSGPSPFPLGGGDELYGFIVGAGYEFSTWGHVGVELMYSGFNKKASDKSVQAYSLMLTVGLTAY
jgi:hypothetical protein